jgi:hypothetical protein
MIKYLNLNESKNIVREMDPYGNNFFQKHCSQFFMNLEDPYLYEYFPEFEFFPEMKEELIQKAIIQYQKINELCIKNNIYPFFKDPTNIQECEKTRLDLVKILPEEIIDKFFGVNSIRDYEPPRYNGDE